jgi:alpha-tubulin suppressor-like RCC1 family protein
VTADGYLKDTPIHVGSDTDWAKVSIGDHFCAIKTDHTLWCWGDNWDGQLGLGDDVWRITPTQVGTDANWADVAASGWKRTCATRTDHTVWCWGANGHRQLGVGDHEQHLVPAQVGTDSDWTGVSAGGHQTCGTRADHTLWCWGSGAYGALGLGGEMRKAPRPTQVGTATDWAGVSAGNFHTCGIGTHHSVWCWGNNASGELGLGDTTDRYTPNRV